jgi:enediyne biosynthesis protein E3
MRGNFQVRFCRRAGEGDFSRLASANVDRVIKTVTSFPPARQADLWSGVGVCCAYAGGADRAAIETLRTAAGPYMPQLAMGAAVVAKGRQRAGNPVPHSDLACEVLCGTSSDAAAHMTDLAFENLPTNGTEPAYEILQQRLVAQFTVPAARVSQRKEPMQ